MAFLEVNNIKKSFGNDSVLNGASFELNEGEVLTIIGSSGNGKSTLLRCLNALETIDEGYVKLNGEIILDNTTLKKNNKEKLKQIRNHFGLVFQQFNLFPQYTAFDNIKLALTLREKEKEKKGLVYLKEEDINQKVLDLLAKVDLINKKDNYPCELSGGQQQRVAIARAMALEPDILCFDEPTSALDPALIGEVLQVIQELKDKLKITMIIVTHEMEFARNISDKVVHLNGGVVVSSGTVEEVLLHPTAKETQTFIESYERLKK